MSADETLMSLARAATDAVADALRVFAPEDVVVGEVGLVSAGASAFEDAELPAVVARISYVAGSKGGSVFAMPTGAARKLAAAMMGMEPEGEGDLSELELSAAGEAMNQMMASAAASASAVLDLEVDITPPDVRVVADHRELDLGTQVGNRLTFGSIALFGHECPFVQLIPQEFTLRLRRGAGGSGAVAPAEPDPFDGPDGLAVEMRRVPLRVSVELGRARLPSRRVGGLGDGAIVELDRAADDPVDVYVNGWRFATGRLVVDGDDWAVRIEDVFHQPEAPTT